MRNLRHSRDHAAFIDGLLDKLTHTVPLLC
jgi:hypothetical protein